jgi:hypothetical protein
MSFQEFPEPEKKGDYIEFCFKDCLFGPSGDKQLQEIPHGQIARRTDHCMIQENQFAILLNLTINLEIPRTDPGV